MICFSNFSRTEILKCFLYAISLKLKSSVVFLSLYLYPHHVLIIQISTIISHPLPHFSFFICRLIGSQDNSSWRGPQEESSPSFCSKQGQLRDQCGFLQALFRWIVKNLKEGGCLVVLMAKSTTVCHCEEPGSMFSVTSLLVLGRH